MKVTLLEPQSYCIGVKRALNLLDETLNNKKNNSPIYLIGKLIHNDIIMNKYKDMGVIIIDENNKLEEIKKIDKGTLIFQAHGTDDKIIEYAKNKGLNVIDATCPFVKIIHNRIKSYLKLNYDIIYVGKKNHAESMGVLSISPKIHFISDINDIEKLNISNNLIYSTCQTTLSTIDLADIFHALKEKYINIIIDNKICDATTKRQEAVINANFDLLIVVGDKFSSNSKRLYEIGKLKNDAIYINDLNELKKYDLTKYNDIAITSGASTPYYLVLEIYNYLIK